MGSRLIYEQRAMARGATPGWRANLKKQFAT
jgi:hypothetical protein